VPGFEGPAAIECDLEEHQITVFFRGGDPFELIGRRQQLEALLKSPVRLRDIQLASHTARFRIARFPPAFFSSVRPGGYSLDDGNVDALLNLNNNDTGVLKLGITLKRGELALDLVDGPPGAALCEELVFTNHSRHMGINFRIGLGKREFDVRYAPKRLFLQGRISQSDKTVFHRTCSLLTLTRESFMAHLKSERVVLSMHVSEPQGHGRAIVSKDALPSSFQDLAGRLFRMSVADRIRTYHEIDLIVLGFEQSRLIEERLTSLFKALESFDACKTLSVQQCSSLLGIERGDAEYLCK
jgi:hypothetical protein